MQETPVVLMRNSERVSFRRCGFKWDLSYNRKLEPTRLRPALEFGSMAHECLELWYPKGTKRGIHPAETFHRLYKEMKAKDLGFNQWDEDGEKHNAYDLGIAMMEGYVELYGDEEWLEVIAPERSMEIDILDRQGNYLCTWVGQGDLLIRDLRTGRIAWLEHKTSKTYVEDVPVVSQYGDQGIAYDWAGTVTLRHEGVLKPDEFVDYILYNFLNKKMPDERPVNEDGHCLNKPTKTALQLACDDAGLDTRGTVDKLIERLMSDTEPPYTPHDIAMLGEPSKTQPSPRYSRARMDLTPAQFNNFETRIRQEAYAMAATRAGKMPVLKNPTRDCNWDCDFRDACEVHEMGGDWEGILEFEFRTWDPYDNHEIEAEK